MSFSDFPCVCLETGIGLAFVVGLPAWFSLCVYVVFFPSWSSDSDAQRGWSLAGWGRRLLSAISGMWAAFLKNDVINWTFLLQCNFIVRREHVRDMVQCVLLLHMRRWQKSKWGLCFSLIFQVWFRLYYWFMQFFHQQEECLSVYLAWWNVFACGGGNREASFWGLWEPEWTWRIIAFLHALITLLLNYLIMCDFKIGRANLKTFNRLFKAISAFRRRYWFVHHRLYVMIPLPLF